MKTEEKQLKDLVAGDIVAVHRMHQPTGLARIVRVTDTQIVVGNYRFNRVTGSKVGPRDQFYRMFIATVSTEEIEKIKTATRRRSLIVMLTDTKWDQFPTETLESITAYLTPTKEE